MRVTLKELTEGVAILLGECHANESYPDESPFPGMEERVRLLAPPLLSALIEEGDELWPDYLRSFGTQPTIDDKGTGYLELPEDYLRLGVIKMSDWNREVRKESGGCSDFDSMMASEWAGVRGNASRSKVAKGVDSSGKVCLKLYGCTSGSRLATGYYIPRPEFIGDVMEMPTPLYAPLIMRIAKEIAT